jgi:hypothetical protein
VTIGFFLLFRVGVAVSGCGSKVVPKAQGSQPGPKDGSASAANQDDEDKWIVNALNKTPDEKEAAREALRHAKDANTGSTFKAILVRIENGWARVTVEETGVPREEAVGFCVYLRKLDNGRWEVVETGSGLTAGDLPGAPPEIFEP